MNNIDVFLAEKCQDGKDEFAKINQFSVWTDLMTDKRAATTAFDKKNISEESELKSKITAGSDQDYSNQILVTTKKLGEGLQSKVYSAYYQKENGELQ